MDSQNNDTTKDISETRRKFLVYFCNVGLSSTLLPGLLWSKMQEKSTQKVTFDMIRDASRLAGLDFSDEEHEMMVKGVNQSLERIEEIRSFHLDNSIPPPLYFNPLVPGMRVERSARSFKHSKIPLVKRPGNLEEVAFWPLLHLAGLIETQQVSAVELTSMYIDRLKRYNPTLNCVVSFTEKRAMEQAKRLDKETTTGHYRGILHGIPWGVKDIISAEGYKTTWGAAPFKDQQFSHDATVVKLLEQAGAVLLAKLSTGELAFGDQWFGGRTNNPWNPQQGSSGSSAGSGSATAAGLVGFAIGTDTGGSILSPSIRCGVVGLRPTFGRVSRFGVMAAGYSLDKIGPMCRRVEDCAIVLSAIAGPDGKDLAVPHDIPFNWDAQFDVKTLKVGYFEKAFDEEKNEERKSNNKATLQTLRSLGIQLQPVELKRNSLTYFIEFIERAAGFDEFARTRQDQGLKRQGHRAELRVSHLVPAVEYLQANRIRMLLMQDMAQLMEKVDVIVAPYRSINPLTSMTGHPVIAVPNGFNSNGTPTGITFMGGVYKEGQLLAVAKAYQDATNFHLQRPADFI
jgi:Asp-tRNA(Asn)/Glu-tRNA(Gln) amidotransferase A subunit family amidase